MFNRFSIFNQWNYGHIQIHAHTTLLTTINVNIHCVPVNDLPKFPHLKIQFFSQIQSRNYNRKPNKWMKKKRRVIPFKSFRLSMSIGHQIQLCNQINWAHSATNTERQYKSLLKAVNRCYFSLLILLVHFSSTTISKLDFRIEIERKEIGNYSNNTNNDMGIETLVFRAFL